jgi:hypothetical protein
MESVINERSGVFGGVGRILVSVAAGSIPGALCVCCLLSLSMCARKIELRAKQFSLESSPCPAIYSLRPLTCYSLTSASLLRTSASMHSIGRLCLIFLDSVIFVFSSWLPAFTNDK